jgi:hypothetical protein
MTTFQLTTEQEELINALEAWYDLKDENLQASLAAYAGFGKTTTLVEFVLRILSRGVPVTIVAPTHAALGQLRIRLGEQENLVYKTVSSALCEIPIISNHSVDINFASLGGRVFQGLLVVDEDSMISEPQALKFARLCPRVLFSGDSGQLKPVKKKTAKAYLDSLEHKFTLSKMLRSNDVIANCALLTRTVRQYVPESTPCGSIVRFETVEELQDAFLEKIKEEKQGDVVWITYTNAEVNALNARAHKELTGRENLDVGDYLRLGANCPLGKNNEVIIVDTIELREHCYAISTKPTGDGTAHIVEVALPIQQNYYKDKIAALVKSFQDGFGGEVEATELEYLRAVVPVDYIYCSTTHESQGASIPYVFANSQVLHGNASFYVAYSRASVALYCVTRTSKTKGFRYEITENTVWAHKKLGTLSANSESICDASAIASAIQVCYPNNPEAWPSASHLACVCNPSHAGKSAKGWYLAEKE